MNDLVVEYRFSMADGQKMRFVICLDPSCLEMTGSPQELPPEWTQLEFHGCRNCPLSPSEHLHCPLALAISHIVDGFAHIVSYDETELEVVTRERTVTQHTTVQRAVSSLMGLVMATSGCPHTAFFRPMAMFHLPLATMIETTYRSVSMYLLAQYFRQQAGLETDTALTGLKQIYADLGEINIAIAQRLRHAVPSDAAVNAVVLLDLFAKVLPLSIDDAVEELAYLFTPYLTPTLR